jgi:hypothetical protein
LYDVITDGLRGLDETLDDDKILRSKKDPVLLKQHPSLNRSTDDLVTGDLDLDRGRMDK